jgi:hypothetical protein
MAKDKKSGVSLAKGPVAIIGLLLLVFGVLAFILGGHSFKADPVSGTVNGEKFLGLEVNAWSSLLFIAAGLLLLFGSPLHWAAKSMSLIVGLALGAASVIALYDEQDVFGIFAANGLTKLVWGAAGALLIVLSLLPRVGGKKRHADARERDTAPRRETLEQDTTTGRPVHSRPPGATRDDVGRRDVTDDRVVAPASGTTPESRETTRRQRERGDL